MTADPLLLGIDLGTSSVKVLLAGVDGRIEGRGQAGYPVRRPAPGRAEQAPEAWWTAVREAVAVALGSAADPHAAGRVAAIGLDGQMHGTVLVDRRGRPVGDAVIWPDQRSGSEVAELTDELGRERIVAAVGGPLATGFQAPTVRWLLRHEPGRWRDVTLVLLPKDWLRLRLCGDRATDPSDASGSGFLDGRTRSWWQPMLDAVGLDAAALPPIRGGDEPAGGLSPAAAEDLGLRAGIPVATGAADRPAGLLGAGLVGPDTMLITLSTGGQLAVPSSTMATDPRGRSHTFCGPLPPGEGVAGWYRMAGILSAGAALRWLGEAVLGLGPDASRRLDGWARDVEPAAGGLLFLPYLAGERSPLMDPSARGAFIGLTARHGRGELARAVMEGVAMACLDAATCLAEVEPLPPTLVLAGGGARSAAWTAMIADVFGRPVRRLATEEQAALGACLLAGRAAGSLALPETARGWARLDEPVEPTSASTARYAELFALFRSAQAATVEIQHRLGALA